MPKILRIINRFNLGGPTYNAAYLSRYMPSEFETLLVGAQMQTLFLLGRCLQAML